MSKSKSKEGKKSKSASDEDINRQDKEKDSSEKNSDIEVLEVKISSLESQLIELQDKNLRMLAEFDNYRRRSLKEKSDILVSAGEDIFKEMLPLIDDFERAIGSLRESGDESNKQVLDGVELIYKKFKDFLTKHDVVEIDTKGMDFSTDVHEAITITDGGEEMSGKVIECIQKGYKLGDKVIRYAKVVVGK